MNNAYLTAKRYIAESIYHMTKLDGLNTTFPETKALLDGGTINNMDLHDVTVISNLKRAWQTILQDSVSDSTTIATFLNLEYFKKINAVVGRDLVINAGTLRTTLIGIGKYTPPLPDEIFIKNKFEEIKKCDNPMQQALELLCFGIKSQNFYDANKRTSFIVANAILVKNNIGIIYVNEEKFTKFNELLSEFLLNDEVLKLKEFFFSECIEFQPDYVENKLPEYVSSYGYVPR